MFANNPQHVPSHNYIKPQPYQLFEKSTSVTKTSELHARSHPDSLTSLQDFEEAMHRAYYASHALQRAPWLKIKWVEIRETDL